MCSACTSSCAPSRPPAARAPPSRRSRRRRPRGRSGDDERGAEGGHGKEEVNIEEQPLLRLVVMGRKSLPDPAERSRRPYWGYVELITTDLQDIKDALKEGTEHPGRVQQSIHRAEPLFFLCDFFRSQMSMQTYRITKFLLAPSGMYISLVTWVFSFFGYLQKSTARRHGRWARACTASSSTSPAAASGALHTHLVYKLELPLRGGGGGEPQEAMNMEPEASFLVQVKNPNPPSSGGGGFRGLESKRRAAFPARLQGAFGSRRTCSTTRGGSCCSSRRRTTWRGNGTKCCRRGCCSSTRSYWRPRKFRPILTDGPSPTRLELVHPSRRIQLGLVHLSSSLSSSASPPPSAPGPATPRPPPLLLVLMAGAAACGPHNVFVYGTLMAEEVVRALLGRAPRFSPARLPGHRRFSIRGRVYPAVLPVAAAGDRVVDGKVFRGITDRELHVLDMFEDEEYVRETVEVSLADAPEKLLAYAYVWANEGDPDLYGEWDFEEWRKVHLKDYLKMTQEFMKELKQSESETQP